MNQKFGSATQIPEKINRHFCPLKYNLFQPKKTYQAIKTLCPEIRDFFPRESFFCVL